MKNAGSKFEKEVEEGQWQVCYEQWGLLALFARLTTLGWDHMGAHLGGLPCSFQFALYGAIPATLAQRTLLEPADATMEWNMR